MERSPMLDDHHNYYCKKNGCREKNHLNIQCKPPKISMTFFTELEK